MFKVTLSFHYDEKDGVFNREQAESLATRDIKDELQEGIELDFKVEERVGNFEI